MCWGIAHAWDSMPMGYASSSRDGGRFARRQRRESVCLQARSHGDTAHGVTAEGEHKKQPVLIPQHKGPGVASADGRPHGRLAHRRCAGVHRSLLVGERREWSGNGLLMRIEGEEGWGLEGWGPRGLGA